MEKTTSQVIFETKEVIKQVIAESHLNISIIDLLIKDLYLEIHELATQKLNSDIMAWNENQNKEDTTNGEHKPVSDGNT